MSSQFLIVAVVETNDQDLINHSPGAINGYLERILSNADKIERVTMISPDIHTGTVVGFQNGVGIFPLMQESTEA